MKLTVHLIVITIAIFSFSPEIRAQYAQPESGQRSEYIANGKIVVGGVTVGKEDAVSVLGEDLGLQYRKYLNQKAAAKTLVRVAEATMGLSVIGLTGSFIAYKTSDFSSDDEVLNKRYDTVCYIEGYSFIAMGVGLCCLLTGGLLSQGASNKVNLIRNTYNKSLSENEVACSLDLTGAGLTFALNF